MGPELKVAHAAQPSPAQPSPAQSSLAQAASTPGAAVTLTALEKRYDGVGAVRGISLDIRSGEFLTLLGPSGSGKTTTLMMIAGFEQPDAGDIAVDGASVLALPPNRRNLGMVFQNYALFPHLSVADNVAFPLKQRGIPRATRTRLVGETLELVHLAGYQARFPRQLSGGQQQRVALARAIVFQPRLLLMDEPLGALDKQLREGLQLELRRLHADLGITFIYVTHDQAEALTMSDRIAVVHEGRIAQLGAPEDLYDRPQSRFVASFIGESNFLEGTLLATSPGAATLQVGPHTLHARAAAPAPRDATHPNAIPRNATPGSPALITMRPERMTLIAQGAPTPHANRLPATITETVFAGDHCRYQLRTAQGATLVAKHPCGATIARHPPGTPIDLAWSDADTSLV